MKPNQDQIKAARKKAHLTQDEAAALVYVTRRAWQMWEAGERAMDGARWEAFLLKAFGGGRIKSTLAKLLVEHGQFQ